MHECINGCYYFDYSSKSKISGRNHTLQEYHFKGPSCQAQESSLLEETISGTYRNIMIFFHLCTEYFLAYLSDKHLILMRLQQIKVSCFKLLSLGFLAKDS
jgi:hypothetical protein